MQTFLPYPSFKASAGALDRQRLGKQRVENLQIMKSLCDSGGWANHPAVKMWAGHELSLLDYQVAICNEWTQVRGYKDTCLEKTLAIIQPQTPNSGNAPEWLGDSEFHRSHQSNLIRKRPDIYGTLWPDVPDDLPYVWPTN